MLLHKYCRNSEPIDVRWHIRRTLLVAAVPTPPPPPTHRSLQLCATVWNHPISLRNNSKLQVWCNSCFKRYICTHPPPPIWISYYFLQVFTLLMNAFWTSLACLVALWFFFAQLPFGFCSSSATDFWSGLPPTFPAYLPTIPSKLCALVSNKYFWPAAAQLCSQSLHLGLLSVRPLWRSRRSRSREALYARVQSRGAISSGGQGGGIYKAATVYAQGCTACLLSHFPLAPFHCPLTCDAADISGRLVNSSSDSGWEGRGG